MIRYRVHRQTSSNKLHRSIPMIYLKSVLKAKSSPKALKASQPNPVVQKRQKSYKLQKIKGDQ